MLPLHWRFPRSVLWKMQHKTGQEWPQITETAIYLSFCWMHMSPQGIHCHMTQQLSPRGSMSVLHKPLLDKWCMLLTVLLFFSSGYNCTTFLWIKILLILPFLLKNALHKYMVNNSGRKVPTIKHKL